MQIRQLWGMTETSPLATLAWPPPDVTEEQHWALRGTQGRPVCGVEARIVDDDGRGAAQRRRVGRRTRGPRPVDHRLVLPQRRRVEVPVRLAAHRRRRPHRRAGLRHADRPRQGRHQVRRGMDLVGRAGEPPDRAPGGARGRRRRGSRRALAGTAAGRDRRSRRAPRSAPQDLRKFLADKVVRWWLPERWTFVDEIPRTSVGKYDKKTIRARHAEGEYDVVTLG